MFITKKQLNNISDSIDNIYLAINKINYRLDNLEDLDNINDDTKTCDGCKCLLLSDRAHTVGEIVDRTEPDNINTIDYCDRCYNELNKPKTKKKKASKSEIGFRTPKTTKK